MTGDRTVDFFIVGEPKSGTSALADFLAQHPSVGISTPKEPHFFATDLIRESDRFHQGHRRHFEVRTERQYTQCFESVADRHVWGEGSTHYLCSTEAAANIAEYNPNARIIAMFRNPADFLHSLHMQYVNNATEDEPDFEAALQLEPARRRGQHIPARTRCPSHLYYSERVNYAVHLRRFMEHFPKEQILPIIAEEFGRDNASTYRSVLQFLGLDDFSPEFIRVNESRAPRYPHLHRALNSLVIKNAVRRITGPRRYDTVKNSVARVVLRRTPRPPMAPDLRQRLLDRFRPEAESLSHLLDRPDIMRLWGYSET